MKMSQLKIQKLQRKQVNFKNFSSKLKFFLQISIILDGKASAKGKRGRPKRGSIVIKGKKRAKAAAKAEQDENDDDKDYEVNLT